MFTTIVLGILLLLAIIGFIGSAFASKKVGRGDLMSPRAGARVIAAAPLVLAVVIGIFACTFQVGARQVAVETAFGKPIASVGNGIHAKAPWVKVEKLDGAVQNDVYSGDNAIEARLGNNGRAGVDASVQWQLKTDDAMGVFLDYKNFEGIQSNLVDRNFRAAVNEVMASYDPLNAKDPAKGGADLAKLADQVQKKMADKVGAQIEVRSVTIPLLNFDESTQNRINDLQAESARTRVAEQKEKTNKAEAKANAALERSITEGTLTSKCLDIVKETKASPLGCFPGTSATPVVSADKKAE